MLVALVVMTLSAYAAPEKRSDSNKDKGLKRDSAIGGMLIGYATQQGETAEDGTRGNSLFALSLASNLKTPVPLTCLWRRFFTAISSQITL